MLKRLIPFCLFFSLFVSSGNVVAQDDMPDTIRFGMNNSVTLTPVSDMLVEHFEETHPGITVEVEYIPNDDVASTFFTQAAAGTLPDVVFIADLYVEPFVEGGVVIDMQPLAEADPNFDLSDIYENLLGLSRVDGEGLYMIPSSYDVVTMFYNKTMFEDAGAPLPEADWTWDDYTAACQTIFDATGNYCFANGSGLPGFDWWAYVVPFIEGYGGQVLSDDGQTVTLDSPESLAGLQAYVDMWTESNIAQPLDFDAGGNCFFVGKCATMFLIPGLMAALRELDPQPFEWDVQVIPSHPEGKFTGMGTYGFAISANSEYPELAWDLVKYLASVDAQLTIAQNYAGIPLLRSLREDPAVVDLPGPPDNILAFIENGPNGIFPPSFPGDCGSMYAGQINQEIHDALEAAIRDMSSVEDAFTQATQNIQDCLDRTQ